MRSIYYQNSRWKFVLLMLALVIGGLSLFYTNRMVHSVRKQERKNMELWANATKALSLSGEFDASLEVLVEIIQANDNIPVILTDSGRGILSYNNIDDKKVRPGYLEGLILEMESQHPPIVIQAGPGNTNYIFYSDSLLLYQLRFYPLFQILVICIFLAIAYAAFNISRRYEQDFLWVGMAKETAHQLGTPISSLMALHAQMESANAHSNASSNPDEEVWMLTFAKDLLRLENITERFSKIGSAPVMERLILTETLEHSLDYIQSRTPSNIIFTKDIEPGLPPIPHNRALMEWVIENLVKNAVDAMPNGGAIHCHLHQQRRHLILDISDTGIGIPRSRHELIFKPGISTRRRGWGLGLTLARRIVELNHRGSIRVWHSEPLKGSTFRIRLPMDGNQGDSFLQRLFTKYPWQASPANHRIHLWGVAALIPALIPAHVSALVPKHIPAHVSAPVAAFSLSGNNTPAAGQRLTQNTPAPPNYAQFTKAQGWTRPLWQVHTVYGLYRASGDLENRFGTSSIVGLELQRQSPRAGWVWSLRGGHLFGGQVKEIALFGAIATPDGDIITANGIFEDYRLRQFGWFVEGRLGKIIFPLGPQGSGIRFDLGMGMLQHKIWIETPNNNSPQLSGEYKRGYDRLCDGLSLSQNLTYQYLAANRRINFQIGLDLIQAFTRERRTVRYDTGLPAHAARHDLLNGLKISWILPIYERSEKAELYFD
jgi:signal transduction histidine kinase